MSRFNPKIPYALDLLEYRFKARSSGKMLVQYLPGTPSPRAVTMGGEIQDDLRQRALAASNGYREAPLSPRPGPTVVLRRLKDNTFPDEPTLTGKTTLTSEPTATASTIGSSRRGSSRFSYQGSSAAASVARTAVTNLAAPTATTLTNIAAPTATNTSSTGSKVTLPSRFRSANYDFTAEKQAAYERSIMGDGDPLWRTRFHGSSIPSAAKTLRERLPVPNKPIYRSARLDPVRPTPPPPSRPTPPVPTPRAGRAPRVPLSIQCDPLPDGKFPRIGNTLLIDKTPETMARTADEDRSIWKFIQKLGREWGEQGLDWLQKRELQWRKRSAVAREAIRRKEAEAEEAERKFSLWEAKRRSEQRAITQSRTQDYLVCDDSTMGDQSTDESTDQSTVLSGIIDLACRWSSKVRRALSRE